MIGTVGRWNYATREYEPYVFPESWNVPLFSYDYDQIANCAECGTELPYGQTFTPLRIHTPVGLGFGVCEACHQQEWTLRREAEAVRG